MKEGSVFPAAPEIPASRPCVRGPWRVLLAIGAACVGTTTGLSGPAEGDYDSLLATGRRAAGRGESREAGTLFFEAVSLDPDRIDAYGELVRLHRDDRDRRLRWTLEAGRIAATPPGGVAFPATFPLVPSEDLSVVAAIARRRREVLESVPRAAGTAGNPGSGTERELARRLVEGLTRGAPAIRGEFLRRVAPSTPVVGGDSGAAVAALESIANRSVAQGDPGTRFEAARILRGLDAQRLLSPGRDAAAGKERVTASPFRLLPVIDAWRSFERTTHTAEELANLPSPAGPEDREKYGNWTHPASTLSPGGFYRVETTCGLQALQVAARDIDRIHGGLVEWFGKDPFPAGARGIVRLVGTYADMESEGGTNWWARGFQDGDRTTVRAAFMGRIGLRSCLTHELTHRFDQAIYPGMPAWLLEGRAVHTEICMGGGDGFSLDESRWSGSQVVDALNAGLTGAKSLRALLDGKTDYRLNYSGGYSLWLFLTTFRGFDATPTADPVFQDGMATFMESCRRPAENRSGAAAFALAFLDGSGGRPRNFTEFATLFDRFLRGLVVPPKPPVPPPPPEPPAPPVPPEPWLLKWRDALKSRGREPLAWETDRWLDDRGTWPMERTRFGPPPWGEDLARRAANLLLGEGLSDAAVAAVEWALGVDEPTEGLLRACAAIHREAGDPAGAWAATRLRLHLFPGSGDAEAGPPPDSWRPTVGAAAGFLAFLAATEERLVKEGCPASARAVRAEAGTLSSLLGWPPAPHLPSEKGEGDPGGACSPWNSLLAGTPVETPWAPLQSAASPEWGIRRSAPWHRTAGTVLLLGEPEGASTSPSEDMMASVLVGSSRHVDGAYTVTLEVRPSTLDWEASVVLGLDSHGRGMEVRLRGSRSRRDPPTTDSEHSTAWISISDSRPLDQRLIPAHERVEVGAAGRFRLTLDVAGPLLGVGVDGADILQVRRTTNAPIEGAVGFCLRRGVVAFVDPKVRVHVVPGPDEACPCGVGDVPLDPAGANPFPWPRVLGRRVRGLVPGSAGGILLWYTEANFPAQRTPAAVRDAVAARSEALGPRAPLFRVTASLPPDAPVVGGAEGAPPRGPPEFPSHGAQPEVARRVWLRGAGSYAKELETGEMDPSRRGILEQVVGDVLESPFEILYDAGGVVRHLRGHSPRGAWLRGDEGAGLVRLLAGW